MPAPADSLLLGLLHGPAELLPLSSSAHVALVPRLLGRPSPPHRVAVALHAGTAAALPWALRGEWRPLARRSGLRGVAVLAAATAPPALVGLALGERVQQRFGGVRHTAAGLLAGAALLAASDRHGGRRAAARRAHDARAADGVLLGLAQAAALWPGLSRTGATLAVARLRGFATGEAFALSRTVALPVLAGTALWPLVRSDGPGADRTTLLAGAAAAASALASGPPLARLTARGGPLWPYAVERAALAALALRRVRHDPAR